MNLDIYNWKDFFVSSIFTIHNGKGITKEEIELNEGNFTAVQSGEEENGIIGKIDKNYCLEMGYPISEKPCLTVARSGSAGFVSFQAEGCVVGDSAKILLLEDSIASTNVYLFLQTLLSANRFKYAYGRKVTESKYMNDTIRLPILLDKTGQPVIDESRKFSKMGYVPDWDYMDSYIKSLHHKPITTKVSTRPSVLLNVQNWQEFTLNRVFMLTGGYYNNKPEHTIDGNIPFLGSTESNNGVTGVFSLEDIKSYNKTGELDDSLENKVYQGNCIAVTVDGSVCNAFYQKEKFTCSHSVTILYPIGHQLNVEQALFICTVIMGEKYRWSYGRKPHDVKKFGKSVIKLPILYNSDGTPFIDETYTYSENGYVPDWKFMENYIKSLPYGDRI